MEGRDGGGYTEANYMYYGQDVVDSGPNANGIKEESARWGGGMFSLLRAATGAILCVCVLLLSAVLVFFLLLDSSRTHLE